MSASPKLTKKQKKGVAFRARKGKPNLEPLDVPLVDVEEEENPQSILNKKRKRDEDISAEHQDVTPALKRVKKELTAEQVSTPKAEKSKSAAKYILFVGNLSYKTTVDSIASHFAACDPPPTIRQLTSRSKDSSSGKQERSKGCAFLEFTQASGLQTALRLHQSELDGRKLNVELSAGGGGKSDTRMKKVREKNAKLDKHRQAAADRKATKDDEPDIESFAQKRHSKTSGAEPTVTGKRTWSIPVNNEKAGRGGQKNRKGFSTSNSRGRRREQPWMSGSNAIPVG